MLNYPIKFQPILQEKICGGQKLSHLLGKPSESEALGESWEISGVKGNISEVANGALAGKDLRQLLSTFQAELVGRQVLRSFGQEFPLLIKFIDAKSDLSVQLHPDDRIAQERHESFGKTEMWYVMQADPGARLNIGFNRSVDKTEYLSHLESGKIIDLLNFVEVDKGDAFFIAPGKVHAIGGGVLIAEIQQTSDITYRIYDWDRTDDSGKPRELHTELALEVIDFEKKEDYRRPYKKIRNTPSNIASCQYFTTNFLPVTGIVERNLSKLDSFVIYMCVEGTASIEIFGNKETIKTGETLLIPASAPEAVILAEDASLLEVYIS